MMTSMLEVSAGIQGSGPLDARNEGLIEEDMGWYTLATVVQTRMYWLHPCHTISVVEGRRQGLPQDWTWRSHLQWISCRSGQLMCLRVIANDTLLARHRKSTSQGAFKVALRPR